MTSGSNGSFGSAGDERTSYKNIGVCYTGGSFSSAVDVALNSVVKPGLEKPPRRQNKLKTFQ